jgi:hypothetical protein
MKVRKKVLCELGRVFERKTGARRREVCKKDFSSEKYLFGTFVGIRKPE